MALVIKDRVKETTTTTGTGTYTLAGAEVGFQSFSTIGNGNTTYYAVTYNNDWEVGIGTYTSSGTTLARTTILSSSNSNNAVNWSSGEKSIFVTQPSSKASFLDASGNLNLSGDIVVSGTVDGRDVAADGTTADNALPKAGGTMSGDIDGNGNKVLFANVYSQLSDLPSASTYHGLFSHVHATGKAYYAHAGNWIELANDADKLNLSGGTLTGNATFGDNNKAIFGAGSDLEVFHNGSNSYITDAGQGKLILSTNGTAVDIYDNANGHTMAQFTNNGAVSLSYQGSTKIATTSTGIDVTGNVAVSGTVDGRDIATNIPASLGTAGQVLTVNSGASAGEWADAGGGADLYAANDVSATAPSATGDNSVAIGPSSEANSADATAFGYRSEAKASKAVAIGEGRAGGNSATAISIGTTSTAYGATGSYSVAMGYQANATGTYAFALGANSVSTGQDSFAGANSRASGTASVAFSVSNNTTSYGASGSRAASIGFRTIASGSNAFSAGYYAKASGISSIALGQQTEATHTRSLAFGNFVNSSAADQVSIGSTSDTVRISERYTLPTADGTNGQVMTTDGSGAVTFADAGGGGADLYAAETTGSSNPTASGTLSIAIGSGATSAGLRAVSIGRGATAAGQDNVAIGSSAAVNSGATKGISIQGNVTGGGNAGSIAIDGSTTANGTVAIGRNVYVQAAYSVALGYNSKIRATASNGTALGSNAIAYGSGSTALTNTYATGAGSFAAAIDNYTATYGPTAVGSVAMGVTAKASGQNSFALGKSTVASGSYSVAHGYQGQTIGSGSFCTGSNSIAEGLSSAVIGGRYGHAKEQGKIVFGGANYLNDGNTINLGFQAGILSVAGTTTDASTRALTSYNNTADTTNQLILPNNSAFTFTGTIIAREKASAGSDYASWEVKGTLLRDANAASTVLGVSIINKLYATSGASAWVIALSADTTNGGLKVEVTGAASTNIRWATSLHTTEVIFA